MITCNNNTSWFVIKGIEKKDFESILELLTESEYSQSKMAHNKSEKIYLQCTSLKVYTMKV